MYRSREHELDVLRLLGQQASLNERFPRYQATRRDLPQDELGFIDLDATIPAASIFLLVEYMYPRQSSRSGVQGLRGTRYVLRFSERMC